MHIFQGNSSDGGNPDGGLTIDQAGNLYGTTSLGGESNLGTVFEISLQWLRKPSFTSLRAATTALPPLPASLWTPPAISMERLWKEEALQTPWYRLRNQHRRVWKPCSTRSRESADGGGSGSQCRADYGRRRQIYTAPLILAALVSDPATCGVVFELAHGRVRRQFFIPSTRGHWAPPPVEHF